MIANNLNNTYINHYDLIQPRQFKHNQFKIIDPQNNKYRNIYNNHFNLRFNLNQNRSISTHRKYKSQSYLFNHNANTKRNNSPLFLTDSKKIQQYFQTRNKFSNQRPDIRKMQAQFKNERKDKSKQKSKKKSKNQKEKHNYNVHTRPDNQKPRNTHTTRRQQQYSQYYGHQQSYPRNYLNYNYNTNNHNIQQKPHSQSVYGIIQKRRSISPQINQDFHKSEDINYNQSQYYKQYQPQINPNNSNAPFFGGQANIHIKTQQKQARLIQKSNLKSYTQWQIDQQRKKSQQALKQYQKLVEQQQNQFNQAFIKLQKQKNQYYQGKRKQLQRLKDLENKRKKLIKNQSDYSQKIDKLYEQQIKIKHKQFQIQLEKQEKMKNLIKLKEDQLKRKWKLIQQRQIQYKQELQDTMKQNEIDKKNMLRDEIQQNQRKISEQKYKINNSQQQTQQKNIKSINFKQNQTKRIIKDINIVSNFNLNDNINGDYYSKQFNRTMYSLYKSLPQFYQYQIDVLKYEQPQYQRYLLKQLQQIKDKNRRLNEEYIKELDSLLWKYNDENNVKLNSLRDDKNQQQRQFILQNDQFYKNIKRQEQKQKQKQKQLYYYHKSQNNDKNDNNNIDNNKKKKFNPFQQIQKQKEIDPSSGFLNYMKNKYKNISSSPSLNISRNMHINNNNNEKDSQNFKNIKDNKDKVKIKVTQKLINQQTNNIKIQKKNNLSSQINYRNKIKNQQYIDPIHSREKQQKSKMQNKTNVIYTNNHLQQNKASSMNHNQNHLNILNNHHKIFNNHHYYRQQPRNGDKQRAIKINYINNQNNNIKSVSNLNKVINYGASYSQPHSIQPFHNSNIKPSQQSLVISYVSPTKYSNSTNSNKNIKKSNTPSPQKIKMTVAQKNIQNS